MKTNQVLLIIWLLLAGASISLKGTAKHRPATTAYAPTTWQHELADYLDYVTLSSRVDKSTTVITFRLDKQHRIQDVVVVAKDQNLIRSIKECLQGRRMLNPCPTITDQFGNERCAIRVHFDMQS